MRRGRKAGLTASTHTEISSLLLRAQPAHRSRGSKARGQSEPASQEGVVGPFCRAGSSAV